jgi:hypothetical protein
MWLAQFVCAPQFFKTPKGLCGHTVYCVPISRLVRLKTFLLKFKIGRQQDLWTPRRMLVTGVSDGRILLVSKLTATFSETSIIRTTTLHLDLIMLDYITVLLTKVDGVF